METEPEIPSHFISADEVEPTNPIEGQIYFDWQNTKNYEYNGEEWIEMGHDHPQDEVKNTFGYRDIYSQGSHVIMWQVKLNGEELSGSSNSVPQAYRQARKAIKRYRRMQKFLDSGK